MGWADVDLSNVNPAFDPIPAGDYVFSLLPGAKYDSNDVNNIKAAAAVAEGESTGRLVFFNFPNPEEFDWSPKALKVMEIALGVDAVPGEDKVQYLNRAVREGGGRFRGRISHRSYKTKAGDDATSVDLKLFSVRPAA